MSFINKTSVSKTSLLSCSLAIALLASACTEKPAATDTQAATTPEAQTEVATSQPAVAPATASNNEEVFVMTKLGLDSINNMIFTPLATGDTLTAEQKSCLAARDKTIGQTELQAYYKDQFSEAQLKELDDFYESSVGQKMLEYGRQELAVMSGQEVTNPMPDPTQEEITQIQAFMQSPTGTKYAQVNNALGEGSAIEALNVPINAEFKRCNIDLTMEQLMQPQAPAPMPAPAAG